MRLLTWVCTVGVLLAANAGLAGEIVLDAKAGNKAPPTENAIRAKTAPRPATVLILPASAVIMDTEGEEGFFPQHGDDSILEERARDSRESAKERQSTGAAFPGNEGDTPEAAAHEGVSDNVSKARAYMKNQTSQRISELPVVSCDNVNNVSGRIGDDSQSGSIITILLNGKQVKARCK